MSFTNVRDYFLQDPCVIANTIDNNTISVRFEDGIVLEVTGRKLAYSMFFWELHKYYPNTPITTNHFVDSVLKGNALSSDTHIQLLTNITKDVYEKYQLNTPIEKEPILGLIYDITNNIHNEVSKLAERYSASIDILDFIEVAENPDIKGAILDTEPNHESISKTYSVVMNTINKDPILQYNSLVKAVRSKMVNANQVAQCVAVRGFLTEVDGTILPVPILSNYTRGLGSLYNVVAESRSAAKSYYFSEAPLQDSEYFARRLQILCMSVEKIHYVDCGSTEYIDWRINPPVVDEKGKTTYAGDLKFMIGKYYLDEETNTLKVITHEDPSLYNKVLKIRSVLNCKHHDKHGVCEVCFGTLAKNISRFANLGHLCCSTMTQQTSQSVLSTKHLDASSVSTKIVLDSTQSKYLTTNLAKNSYLIKKELTNRDVKLVINRDEAPGLTDILSVDDVENINPIRITGLTSVEISVDIDGNLEGNILFINQENRKAVLTMEFLRFLRKYKWETDNKNNFVFDLTHWDFSKPVFKLPEMEYSFADHSLQISKIIESNMKEINKRMKPGSPVYTLQELFNLVNTKLNVNIAALEVIIYSAMVGGPENYDLARNYPEKRLGISDKILKNRSLGAAYSYETQNVTILSPSSFFKLNRPDSVFDAFITPREVVESYKGK